MIVLTFNIPQHFEDGAISMDRFTQDLGRALGTSFLHAGTHGDDLMVVTQHELSLEQMAMLKAAMADHRVDKHHLPTVKAQKCAAIDARTRELLSEGFVAFGFRFSLSIGAQLKLLRLDALRHELEYPVIMNTLEDGASYSVDTPETMHSLAMRGLMTIHDIVESGTDLKNLVRAAQSPIVIGRIVDLR